MDIMESIEVTKLYNRNIKRSQSFLYIVLAWRFLTVLALHQNFIVFSRHVVCEFLLLTRMCKWGKNNIGKASYIAWSVYMRGKKR